MALYVMYSDYIYAVVTSIACLDSVVIW